MYNLDKNYQDRLDAISKEIQASELLSAYLEEEEDELYKPFQEEIEPKIAALHEEVMKDKPLQIIAFENALLDESFEGLFIPRMLGYSVLRGELNQDAKYVRPQNHFKSILMAICGSANFDVIKQRIGQSVQMGFALSSDIWVTNFINDVNNKKIKFYLQNLISNRFRDPVVRLGAHDRYAKQFYSLNFLTAEFPENRAELANAVNNLGEFLLFRQNHGLSHESYVGKVVEMINNTELRWDRNYINLLSILANHLEANDDYAKAISSAINDGRKSEERFNEIYFDLLKILLTETGEVNVDADKKMANILDMSIEDDMKNFYSLMNDMHSKGYVHDDTVEAVRTFYNAHEGLSTINQCLRLTVLGYFSKLLRNLEVADFHEYFELSKIFAVYMNLFSNESFNQGVKKVNLEYVKKLIKTFTDKRGKDYQEVKKFVATTFVDFNFMKDKEVVELFKTKRKKKVE